MLRIVMFFLNSYILFFDDRSQLYDFFILYLVLDRFRDEVSLSRDVEFRLIVLYFLCGLVRLENIIDFNFDLFLYDSLQLLYGLFFGDFFSEVE